MHRPLWLTEGTVSALRRHLRDNQPTVRRILEQSEEIAAQPVPRPAAQGHPGDVNLTGLHGVSCAICYLLTEKTEHAQSAFAWLQEGLAPQIDEAQELRLGQLALNAAVLQECCRNGWSEEQQQHVAWLLVRIATRLREVHRFRGDPHSVTNNHWAVAHAGAAMAAMAAHGAPRDGGGTWDLRETITWARERTKAFVGQHGDAGLYHEGLGYGMYPMAFWLPMAVAAKNFDGWDLLADFPRLRRAGVSMMSTMALRPVPAEERQEGDTPRVGVKLSWNDDGLGWESGNVSPLLSFVADPAHRGGLRTWLDRSGGVDGDASFGPQFSGRFFWLIYYPYDVSAEEPDAMLPRHVFDSRQGMAVFRNRWRDDGDAVFGAYARVFSPGGHRHDDGGAIRFMALGHDWIMGGGQARGQAEYQSVVAPTSGPRPKPPGTGAVLWHSVRPNGGVFGMDLRPVSLGYHERWTAVDFGIPGTEAALAVLDIIDDHAGRDWAWHLTFEIGLQCALHEDGRGFTLSADEAGFVVRLLGSSPDGLTLERMPDSSRRFQSGGTGTYPGRPYVRAFYRNQPHLGIYAVMSVQKGTPPQITAGDGLDVSIGDHAWSRPFGAAIPAVFHPGLSGGMSKFPGGHLDYRAPATPTEAGDVI